MLRSLAFLVLISIGCGAASTEDESGGRFEAGELDPYGCPFVDPVPWEDSEAHQEVCGPGCEPYAGRAPGADHSFVACLGEEVPRPDPGQPDLDVVVCLLNPVTGGAIFWGTPSGAYPLVYLCWSSVVFPFDVEVPPECFTPRREIP